MRKWPIEAGVTAGGDGMIPLALTRRAIGFSILRERDRAQNPRDKTLIKDFEFKLAELFTLAGIAHTGQVTP